MRRALLIAFAAVGAAGCASVAPPETPPAAASARAEPSVADTAERLFRARADEAMRRRDYGEALVQWQILLTLRPTSTEYANQLRATHAAIAEVSAAAMAAGDAARRRGDLEQATVAYLRVVSVDRENVPAAQALREIERERNRRLYLTRAPRGMVAAAAPAATARKPALPTSPDDALGDADQGAILYRQGDWAGAAQSLQRAVLKNPQDSVSRAHLADAYYQLAVSSQARGQKQEALAYYQRAQTAGYPGGEALNRTVRELKAELAAEQGKAAARAGTSR